MGAHKRLATVSSHRIQDEQKRREEESNRRIEEIDRRALAAGLVIQIPRDDGVDDVLAVIEEMKHIALDMFRQ